MKSDTAFLLIDMQKEDGFAVEGFDAVIDKAASLLAALREQGIPVIYSKHVNRIDGVGLPNGEPRDASGKPDAYCSTTESVEIIDALAPQAGEIVIEKNRYSSFFQSELDALLKQMGVKHLLIGGVLTDVCVMTTVFDAYFRDYQVTLLEDLCGATTGAAHYSSLLIMANWVYDLEIFTVEEYLRFLQGQEFVAFKATVPDEFAHAPEGLVEAVSKLRAKINK
ncbi:cysteine hydrolase [Pseudomonas cavernicola]|uniref:Cysteine hydrolase n=1 Tax=Pseudomonas cavernicola TaxID=2320866 RepID=A0A418XM85_9PSED|nr:isochorismatase family cysteine hydrolase [Pseudomonas cavernicola]RJG13580.1 cysteine hydrolase [Pseudomonas cavernicola]